MPKYAKIAAGFCLVMGGLHIGMLFATWNFWHLLMLLLWFNTAGSMVEKANFLRVIKDLEDKIEILVERQNK